MATYDFRTLVVAGGGGGGGSNSSAGGGGGGGAGGYQEDATLTLTESTSYAITVGGGGAGGTDANNGSNGGNSSIGAALVSSGGGGGGTLAASGLDGGSGGGEGGSSFAGAGGNGTAGQGSNGGAQTSSGTGGGGGGGQSAVGASTSNNDGGAGGAGLSSDITGSAVTRAGGGGGGGNTGAAGGAGGGGSGGGSTTNGSPGTANTGGGGGGCGRHTSGSGGAGGAGVVIIRFATADVTVLTSTGATETTTGSDTVLTWNTTGTFEFELAGGGGGSPAVTTSSGGPIPLALQLYEERGGALIADLSDATDCVIDNGRHGFRSLSCFVPMPLELAFAISEQSKGKWLSLNYGCGVAWEGRVEDPTVIIQEDGTGLALTAFGAWRSFYDAPYTALWSKSGTAGWRAITNSENSVFQDQKYEIDNNNRLYIAPKKNEVFSNAGSYGVVGYVTPDGGSRQIIGIQFDIQMNAPAAWNLLLQRRTAAWAGSSTEYTLAGTGSATSRCVNITFTGIDNLVFLLYYNAASATYTGETGDVFVKITNIRLVTASTNRISTSTTTTISAGSQVVTPASMTGVYVGQRLCINSANNPSESVMVTAVTSTTFTATFANGYSGTTSIRGMVIYADEIISDLVAHVTTINPAQLSDSTALIESPRLDLLDESYEDAWPGDIATKLARLGDNQSPPRLWEVGVWEGQKLHFRPKGSDGQVWAVDADELTVNSTLELLRNSMYASYQDANNRTLRTAVADDATSQAQYGITRRGVVSASTTSATQAETHRDAALEDGRTIRPRSELQPDYLMDQTGAIAPKWLARGGQTMNIRNLPPTLGSEVDRIRTFLLEENSYDVMEDVLTPVPEEPVASLEVLVARRSEGF